MPDIFLSYSREDLHTARPFADVLKAEGFTVWWDQAIDAGQTFDKATERALKEARAVVVLWSPRSVESRWVRSEATLADRLGTLVPVMIESCDRPIQFELMQSANLIGWRGEAADPRWQGLVAGLKRQVERGAAVSAPQPSAIAPTGRAPGVAMVTESRRRLMSWSLGAAAILAILAGAAWYLHVRAERSGASKAGASVAVLPFRDMSPNKDQEYFADGITEEILNTLAGIKDLKVTARTSAFAFKGQDIDLRSVGKALDVRHILEGSVRKDGQKLRITAQLIDTRTDAHLWSRTYDRPLQDVFAVQDDIARSVAAALQVSLGVGFGDNPTMTRDVVAYDNFLEANALLMQFNRDSALRAIGLLEQSLARDPAFPRSLSRLPEAYASMAGFVTKDREGWQQKSRDAYENMLRQTPADAPQRPGLLARRSANQGLWKEAGKYYKEAAELAARRGQYLDGSGDGAFLLQVGKARESLIVHEQYRANDPLNSVVPLGLASSYAETGNLTAAFAESERGRTLSGPGQYVNHLVGLTNALATRDRPQIDLWLDRLIEITSNPEQATLLVRMRQLLDRPTEALAYLRQQSADPDLPVTSRIEMARWLAYHGDAQATLDTFRFALNHGAPKSVAANLWFPVYQEMRKLPDFRIMVADYGFVDYWREYGWGDFCNPLSGTDDFECH